MNYQLKKSIQKQEELHQLSLLRRKYPQEAMNHLSLKDMAERLREHGITVFDLRFDTTGDSGKPW